MLAVELASVLAGMHTRVQELQQRAQLKEASKASQCMQGRAQMH